MMKQYGISPAEAEQLIEQAWNKSLDRGEKYSPEQIGAFKGILAVWLSAYDFDDAPNKGDDS